MKYKNQFRIFCLLQFVSAIGIFLCYIGLYIDNNYILVTGTLIYAVFTFPSFPVMMELIGKRVGSSLELVATGNVFFLTQVITAILLAIIGFILNEESKANSTYSFIIILAIIFSSLIFGILSSKTFNRKFISSLDDNPQTTNPEIHK